MGSAGGDEDSLIARHRSAADSAVKPKCAHLRGPASGTSGGRGDAVVARPGWRICCSGGIGFEAAEMARHNNMAVDLIIWIGVLGASISLDEYVD